MAAPLIPLRFGLGLLAVLAGLCGAVQPAGAVVLTAARPDQPAPGGRAGILAVRAAQPLPLPPPPPPPPPPLPEAAAAAEPAAPAKPAAPPKPEAPAKPPPELPRFVSLRSDEVNLRAGPGTRYPIQWVYRRRDLPVEIEREFEVWRLVRDVENVRGWVHQATLTGRRTFVVEVPEAIMRTDPKDSASQVAKLRKGVIGRLRACDAGSAWCEVRVGSLKGYIQRAQIWGLKPNEVVKP